MIKDPERSLSKTQHLAARNLMDANEIMMTLRVYMMALVLAFAGLGTALFI